MLRLKRRTDKYTVTVPSAFAALYSGSSGGVVGFYRKEGGAFVLKKNFAL